MSLLILTGPTGAGKNTIAAALARKRDRCAVIDFDAVRAMFVQPHRAPWEGEEGRTQQLLGVRNVSDLAQNFIEAGWEVIVLDVLSEETAQMYRQLLQPFRPTIVMLLPTFKEIELRNLERKQREGRARLTDEELGMVYDQQRLFKAYDLIIDNTHIAAEEVAAKLARDAP